MSATSTAHNFRIKEKSRVRAQYNNTYIYIHTYILKYVVDSTFHLQHGLHTVPSMQILFIFSDLKLHSYRMYFWPFGFPGEFTYNILSALGPARKCNSSCGKTIGTRIVVVARGFSELQSLMGMVTM